MRTASITVELGLTVTSGVRAILRRPINTPPGGIVSWLGDTIAPLPILHYDSDMVLIPEGWFWMGSENRYSWESPRHRIWLSAYEIAHSAVTRREYEKFVKGS